MQLLSGADSRIPSTTAVTMLVLVIPPNILFICKINIFSLIYRIEVIATSNWQGVLIKFASYNCYKESMQEEILDCQPMRRYKIEGSSVLLSAVQENGFQIGSLLFGYLINHLDLDTDKLLINDFRKVFGVLKDAVSSKNHLSKKNAVMLVYDILQEIKDCRRGVSYHRIQDLPQMLRSNISEMIRDETFIQQKWKLQDQIVVEEREAEQLKVMQQLEKKKQDEDRQMERLLVEEEREKIRLQEEEKRNSMCHSCLVISPKEELLNLQCYHNFHPECLKWYTVAIVESNRTTVSCPKADCNRLIPNNLILDLLGSEEELKQKYEESLLFELVDENRETMAWCPGFACRAILYYSEGDTFYRCQSCNKSYCLTCGCQQHTDLTCAQYEARRPPGERRVDFKEPKFKKCPQCNIWVERSRDGLIMRCRCGCQFCFQCSGRECTEFQCRARRVLGVQIE